MVIALSAALLLTGCGAGTEADRAETIRETYAAAQGCSARAEVAAAREDETLRYTLDIEKNGDETHLTVVEPEALAGIGVTVSGDDLSLRYDSIVLDAGSADTEISAVNAFDIVWNAIVHGWVVERDAARFCFETERGDKRLRVAVWFDEANRPTRAEIEDEGKILSEIRFTNFNLYGTINRIA